MIRYLAISWLSGVMALAAAEPTDLLRFGNGDQLHGTFKGIQDGPRAMWQRDDVDAPVGFKTGDLRHIVLRGGQPVKSLTTLSHVAMVNGDRIPGVMTGMDAKTITLETQFSGSLKVPREKVSMFAPSPLGGRIHYHGPFTQDGWTMSHAEFPDGFPPEKKAEAEGAEPAAKEAPAKDAPAKVAPARGGAPQDPAMKDLAAKLGAAVKKIAEEDGEEVSPNDERTPPGRWGFSGAAWYWPGKEKQYGTALMHDGLMPDRSILRFDVAWKNRLYLAIGFHSDFQKPKPKEGEEEKEGDDAHRALRRMNAFGAGDSTIYPLLFGNSYVLQLFPTNIMLFRSNSDGRPIERLQISGSAYRLGETGKATVEIRSNRVNGNISVFVNDEFVAQWNEGGNVTGSDLVEESQYAGKGSGFGFLVPTEDSPVKISDIMIGEWNGMPDSARSLQVEEQDIVLLANGTDRFSGKVGALENGKISLDGKYGRFQFAVDDIAEIRFAKGKLAPATTPAEDDVTVRLSPLGKVSGRPLSGSASSIRMVTPDCGEIDFNLDSAVMMEFEKTDSFIDAWDDEF